MAVAVGGYRPSEVHETIGAMRRVLVGLVLGVALLVSGSAGSADPGAVVPGRTVRSADGLLTVSIPRGALRKNVRVRVRTLSRAQWPRQLRRSKSRPAGKVYELEPDGLQFMKPVTVTRRLKGFDLSKGLPGVWFVTQDARGRWALLGKPAIKLQDGVLVATGTTRHFSPVATFDGGIRVQMNPPSLNKKVGEDWRARLDGNFHLQTAGSARWKRSGAVGFFGDPPSPVGYPYPWAGFFDCEKEGPGTYAAEVEIRDSSAPAAFLEALLKNQAFVGFRAEVVGTAFCTLDPSPPPPPPPPPPPSCSQSLTATLTTYNSELHAQVFGQCDAYLSAGWSQTRLFVPAGKLFTAYSAHTPGPCTFTSSELTCPPKSDGRVCTIVNVNPSEAPGDQFRIVFLNAGGTPINDVTLPLGPQQATCAVGG